MSITFSIALYFVIWWTVLFAVLPFGVRTQHEEGVRVPGTPASAPGRPRFLFVVIATSIVAAIILALIFAGIHFRLFDWLEPPTEPIPGTTGG